MPARTRVRGPRAPTSPTSPTCDTFALTVAQALYFRPGGRSAAPQVLFGGVMLTTAPAREIPPFTYEPQDDMPPAYRQSVVRILTIQARIETEYPKFPERSLLP